MRAPLLSTANSISKPSVRRHSSSENLFADYHHLHLQPQDKQTFPFSAPPPSPSRKAHSTIYVCIAFIFFFFIITIAACLHCGNIDPPHIVVHTSPSTNPIAKGQKDAHSSRATPALKGLGTVFIRGTKVMSELVVAHIAEDTQVEDLKLFLRTLYRSGLIARADTVLLFPWNTLPASMIDVIHEENHSFQELLHAYTSDGDLAHDIANSSFSTSSAMHASSNASISPFNINAYKKASAENEVSVQLIWGLHTGNFSHDNRSDDAMQQFRWGSVIGFDASELNPDDTLQGFFDHPPVMLRRWACYQMLLGMVRHRFKHVLLTDVSGAAILGDPFTMARRRVGLYLALEDRAWGALNAVELGVHLRSLYADSDNELPQQDAARDHTASSSSSSSKAAVKKPPNAHVDVHQRGIGSRRRARKGAPVGGLYERVYGKRMWSSLEEFERTKKLVNSGAIVGGIHQVRGLANAMVTEIVKVALERTNRDAFPDSVLLSYLLHKSSSILGKRVLEHLHLLDNAESFVHSLSGSQQSSLFFKRSRAAYQMIQGNHKSKRWFAVVQAIHYDICASPADAMVYIDCIHTQASRKVFVTPPLKFM